LEEEQRKLWARQREIEQLETERKLAEDIKVKKKERNTNRNELKQKEMNKEIKRNRKNRKKQE